MFWFCFVFKISCDFYKTSRSTQQGVDMLHHHVGQIVALLEVLLSP